MNLKKQLNNLIVKYRIALSRKHNLYFLVDEWEIEKLLELLELKKGDKVAVIRSNAGLLEQKLAEYETIVFEPFQKISEIIEKEFCRKNLKLVKGYFSEAERKEFNKVIAIKQLDKKTLFMLLKSDFNIAVLLANANFAEKIIAEPGFLDYCEMSVLTQYYCKAELAGDISPEAFFPKLKNGLRIIKLVKKKLKDKEDKIKNAELFEEFVKNVFRYKKKNAENALKNALKAMHAKESEKNLGKIKIPEKKVMLLSVKELVHLFNELF